ncbi:MAG: hypothetical protein HYZ31_08560 [Gammaproteobacteria bacterium]|nr:hypothetical protein [Gammaproteobacteria bacterium]
MAGKLIEPTIISDFNNHLVAMLPTGFYFDDARWEKIWQRYDQKGETLTMADLLELFPDEPVLQAKPLQRSGDMSFK